MRQIHAFLKILKEQPDDPNHGLGSTHIQNKIQEQKTEILGLSGPVIVKKNVFA